MGYIICYANGLLVWASRVQSTYSLSTTEAKYHALSATARKVIYLTRFWSEIKSKKIADVNDLPSTHCKVFEDNSGALELARVPKMQPHTKHINVEVHHFRLYIRDKLMKILPINLKDQPADIFT
eukprot:7664482-Ditylum_brightwellii.AAC.1